jgi:hypothetical protein
MKNIHLLPTDKPSRLRYNLSNVLVLTEESYKDYSKLDNQHIYITCDEEIKEEDWAYVFRGGTHRVEKAIHNDLTTWKKIILTTDQDLIKDGVQAIDDEFLEWFVKNPSCEEVEVEDTCLEVRVCDCGMNENCLKPGYTIIIPQEESKQETLKEAAINNYPEGDVWTIEQALIRRLAFMNGAKCQAERMYSEEEVKRLAFDFYYDMSHQMGVAENLISENATNVDVWFNQFKKK